ncbi:MAG: hypothetical protein LBS63_03910 [Prevotellaceae bacterium]|jgi:hypothetical protein|nr:hypothetical protein [Prevotellaceae bacterium]
MNTIAEMQAPAAVSGMVQTLRAIRDKLSLEHVNMTAREELEYYAKFRERDDFWLKDTCSHINV